jgi:predicted TIM-barrel fold metal-dependent hydrolase
VAETIAVAWKHRNVCLEIGGVSPKYIAKQGSGWEPLFAYATVLQDQILFATDSAVSHERVVKEAQELPVKDLIKKTPLPKCVENLELAGSIRDHKGPAGIVGDPLE